MRYEVLTPERLPIGLVPERAVLNAISENLIMPERFGRKRGYVVVNGFSWGSALGSGLELFCQKGFIILKDER